MTSIPTRSTGVMDGFIRHEGVQHIAGHAAGVILYRSRWVAEDHDATKRTYIGLCLYMFCTIGKLRFHPWYSRHVFNP